jgi:hypothetical protein
VAAPALRFTIPSQAESASLLWDAEVEDVAGRNPSAVHLATVIDRCRRSAETIAAGRAQIDRSLLQHIGIAAGDFVQAMCQDTKRMLEMSCRIPKQQGSNFDCEGLFDYRWRTSPSAPIRPRRWSEEEHASEDDFQWRGRWVRFPTCFRVEWQNHRDGEVTSITVLERNLVSSDVVNCKMWVYPVDADPDDSSRYLVAPKGVTYVRFRDYVQSGATSGIGGRCSVE